MRMESSLYTIFCITSHMQYFIHMYTQPYNIVKCLGTCGGLLEIRKRSVYNSTAKLEEHIAHL